MKKVLFFVLTILCLSANAEAISVSNAFAKNYVEVHKKATIQDILQKLNEISDNQYVLSNKNKNFNIRVKDKLRIYDISDLNKFLVKNGYPYQLKIEKEKDNNFIVRVVDTDTLNAYDIKGVRLLKGITVKEVFNKLNKQKWVQSEYQGRNFKIPANPNIVIKNLIELQKYLNAVSPYSIFLKKATDVNNDGITDIEVWGRTITERAKGETIKQAIIRHLEIVKNLANGMENKSFNKELFKKDIEQTIQQLKSLQQ